VTGGWITPADRERWQRDAARELAAILDAHPGLPPITWAVGRAGGSLAGRAGGSRAAFTAWQQALGLDDVLEVPAGSGTTAWLRAHARRHGIRVTVTATVGETGTAP
jgi:hypothetical protein